MDIVVQQLLLNTIALSLLVFIILLLKKALTNHMSVKTHYKIWFFLFVPLFVSIFPWNYLGLGEGIQYIKNLLTYTGNTSPQSAYKSGGLTESNNTNTDLIRDFSVSVHNSTPEYVSQLVFAVWIIGMVLCLVILIYSNYQLNKLKKSAVTIKNNKINVLLEECKEVVGMKRNIILKETPLITTPITFGIFKPYILVPSNIQAVFTLKEIKYVLLHELTHHKNKDMLVNYVMWILQIVYWFNPLLWYSLKRIRIDRELACDDSVLNLLDESGYIEYGHTIIRFAHKKQEKPFELFASGIGGTKQQIKQRIQSIANFSKASSLLKWKSNIICMLLGILVLVITPLTTVIAASNAVFHFDGNNTTYEDLDTYFKGYKGSFVLYDAANNHFQIYNRKLSEQRVSPDSTYKIYSGLFALESNIVSINNSEQKWNGKSNPFKEWDKDHNLTSAMRNSVNWYFQNLDQEVGDKHLQAYFNKVNYGNKDMSGGLDTYWMESSLKISPIEQVILLHELSENKFGFKTENVEAIKEAMLIDDQKDKRLYGKTGTGTINGKNINGWFVGFVKKGEHSYYFAINIQNQGTEASGSKAMEIAKQILKDKNIY
ncbi:BlaR1 family beta-lactam sensor/signal transducer [Niallia taxi]|uniref:BlaR1 family beta-lactam sensor/signal transducer n=1 Tax=Niallia taxi TaxID=2499688 RepID=UPI0015F40791|nr:BlaR1 family beta-lactam sensor/signal transducer [Niallia taxi]MDK8640736.1 BlaR1 family beta-lactam sensor/signal transducer [Niallia taxi]